MATIDAPTIAQLLREFAGRASLRGGNPYTARARIPSLSHAKGNPCRYP
jgi:hypothetical protein